MGLMTFDYEMEESFSFSIEPTVCFIEMFCSGERFWIHPQWISGYLHGNTGLETLPKTSLP
jgi:hypothetical protein